MKKRYIFLTIFSTGIALLIFFSLPGGRPTFKKPVGKPNLVKSEKYNLTATDLQFLNAFDSYVSAQFDETNTPGASIVIVKKGNVIYEKAFGVKSAGGRDSVDTKTMFRIASVSKGFSAILAGLAVEDGLIDWNDPIAHYVGHPLLDSIHNITIKHILSHTGGFPYQAYSTLVEDDLPRDTMISRLLKIPLTRLPGTIHSYQNVAYSIIERVLESSTGKSFNQLMHERIFAPLKMTYASMCYDSMVNNGNIAIPHGYRHRKFVPTTISRSYYNVASAGGLNTNIEDMGKWLKAVLGNSPRVIPEKVLDKVFTPIIQIRVKNPYFSHFEKPREGYYGLGWRIMEYPEDTLVYHGGYANGYKSGIALDRNKEIGICVLTNAPSKFSNIAMIEFFKMYKEYFKEPEELETIKSLSVR